MDSRIFQQSFALCSLGRILVMATLNLKAMIKNIISFYKTILSLTSVYIKRILLLVIMIKTPKFKIAINSPLIGEQIFFHVHFVFIYVFNESFNFIDPFFSMIFKLISYPINKKMSKN